MNKEKFYFPLPDPTEDDNKKIKRFSYAVIVILGITAIFLSVYHLVDAVPEYSRYISDPGQSQLLLSGTGSTLIMLLIVLLSLVVIGIAIAFIRNDEHSTASIILIVLLLSSYMSFYAQKPFQNIVSHNVSTMKCLHESMDYDGQVSFDMMKNDTEAEVIEGVLIVPEGNPCR